MKAIHPRMQRMVNRLLWPPIYFPLVGSHPVAFHEPLHQLWLAKIHKGLRYSLRLMPPSSKTWLFMELRSQSGRALAQTQSAPNIGISTGDPANVRSPVPTFRSPVVGRRRRRSSERDEDPRVANTFLGMGQSHSVDVSDPGAMEGLIRGSRRRRLHMDGNDRDRRMEVEPGTPV
jgi:hypothetical protein